jgi:hypothetical protein
MSRHLYRGGHRRACTCGHTLAVQRGNALHISEGDFHIVASGQVWLLCPACQVATTINTTPAPRMAPSCTP